MAEFSNSALQTISAGNNFLFTDSPVSCNKGYVIHREGSGIITLRGIVNNPCNTFARYLVTFGGNIAIPTGGTVEAITVAIAVDGESLNATNMIVTPAAVREFWNVHASTHITVPRGCCYTISVENVSTQAIECSNCNIIIERTA